MAKRIICDTCSAIKLAYFGNTLFTANTLKSGDLILHQCVFTEIKKWHPTKKGKYKKEIETLEKIRATPGLRVDRKKELAQEVIIRKTRDDLNLSVGKGDITQLVAILLHDLHLVTNDNPFKNLAEAMEVAVFEAELIAFEGIEHKVLTSKQVQDAVDYWEANEEKQASKAVKSKLAKHGVKYK
jgi:hypothetical protein